MDRRVPALLALAACLLAGTARADDAPADDEPCAGLRLTGQEDRTADVVVSGCTTKADRFEVRARDTATGCGTGGCDHAHAVCVRSKKTGAVVFEASDGSELSPPKLVLRCRNDGVWFRVDHADAVGAEIPLEWNRARTQLVPTQQVVDDADRLLRSAQSRPALQRIERLARTFRAISPPFAARLEDAAVPLRAEVGGWSDASMRVLHSRALARPDDEATERAVDAVKRARRSAPFRTVDLGRLAPLASTAVFGAVDGVESPAARRVIWQGRRLCIRDETTAQRSMTCWSTDTRRFTALEPMPPAAAQGLRVAAATTDADGTCPATYESPEIDALPAAPRALLFATAVTGTCVVDGHGLPVMLAPALFRLDDHLVALVPWREGGARLDRKGLTPLDAKSLVALQRLTEGAPFVLGGRLRAVPDFEVVPRDVTRAALALANVVGVERRWPLPSHWKQARASPDGRWLAYVAGTDEAPWLGAALVEDAKNVVKKPSP